MTLRSHENIEKPDLNVAIELTDPVSLTFSLKYLVNFCKAQGLSGTVKLCLSPDVPLLVEYTLAGSSYLRFYLAPKASSSPTTIMVSCTNWLYRLVMRTKCLVKEKLAWHRVHFRFCGASREMNSTGWGLFYE